MISVEQKDKIDPRVRERAMVRVNEIARLPVYRDRPAALVTDLYQLTMMYGYFRAGRHQQRVVFDLFYRNNPSENGYVIAAGLEQVVWYLNQLQFRGEELEYLRSLNMFSDAFIDKLQDFRFTGDVYAVPEGTIVFPNEPLVRVEGPIFEVQLIESALLTFVNHQSLIATKTQRIVDAAATSSGTAGPVIEMGLRRAQNMDASVFGARAAFIGGCVGTSNVLAGQCFDIPVMGTMGHSWIQSFPSELDAFRAYADTFPDNTVLLIDTYDVLKSGIQNAIIVARELEAKGKTLRGVRIDSGDLAYLSKRVRSILDAAGLPYVGITASSDLDEWIIRDLIIQGAAFTAWGVGTRLITSYDTPSLGGVYKLVAHERDGVMHPSIKISENAEKVTNPGKKKVLRFYVDGHASADLIALDDETFNTSEPLELFDPVHTYKRKVIRNYEVENLLVPVFLNGELVYELPTLRQIRQRVENGLSHFSSEILRPVKPHIYHVDLSKKLWELKHHLLHEFRPE
ncbi:nicotinate phosphoribosyltransferase [Alicyclobacillus mengziensis]|uniref:Nicotinate phosphoribosyltransferase n=2 Tax=Alicyclobacillus mengziensis TaxID=2931921 RepID=A0A9X7W3M8_9BACL|nr:nicotinate phosphoribosyltransferase [Alicyclobacillus mengziensis]